MIIAVLLFWLLLFCAVDAALRVDGGVVRACFFLDSGAI
jgi:hypothetical protein